MNTPPHLIPAKTAAAVHALEVCEPDAAQLVYEHLTRNSHFPWMFKPSQIEREYTGAYVGVVTTHWHSKGRYSEYHPGDRVLVLPDRSFVGEVTVWNESTRCHGSIMGSHEVRRAT